MRVMNRMGSPGPLPTRVASRLVHDPVAGSHTTHVYAADRTAVWGICALHDRWWVHTNRFVLSRLFSRPTHGHPARNVSFYMVTMNVIYLGTVLQIWFLWFVKVVLGMSSLAGCLDGGLLYATDGSFVRGVLAGNLWEACCNLVWALKLCGHNRCLDGCPPRPLCDWRTVCCELAT